MRDYKLHANRLVVQGQAPDEVRTFTAPSGATINLITAAPKPAFTTDLVLVEVGFPKDSARKVILAAGGRVVGRRVVVSTEKLEAYLAAGAGELAPSARAPKKTPKKGADTAATLASNGLRIVKGGDE